MLWPPDDDVRCMNIVMKTCFFLPDVKGGQNRIEGYIRYICTYAQYIRLDDKKICSAIENVTQKNTDFLTSEKYEATMTKPMV